MLGVEYRDVMKQNSAFNQALGTASVLAKEIVGDFEVGLVQVMNKHTEKMSEVMSKATQVKETMDKDNTVAGYEYKIDYEKYLNEFMEVMKDEEEPKDPA